jgi:hypothetical protein
MSLTGPPQPFRGGQVFRVPPALPAAAMKTYQIASPLSTHWHPVTCAEAECDAWLHGWVSYIDESAELGQRQAHYIRKESGRRFTEERNETGITEFTFEAGQRCFKSDQHRARNMRPERYLVRGGDWRGNPTGERREHKRPADWQDDFATHQDRLRTALERG